MKAIDLIHSQPWAITPEVLETICAIALRQGEGPEAVAARLGRPLENTRKVTVRGGVAVIPISGPIFPKANLFTEVSGATSIQTLATDLTAALDDPAITAIVLDMDSPGGAVSGVNEFHGMVKAATEKKPVVAYVGTMAASAAYWIASAATQIVIEESASAGSLGVLAAFKPEKADGTVEIVSNQSPDKRVDPTTDKGRAKIQAHVDRLAEVFISAVASGRKVSKDVVLSEFGRGGLLVGTDAVAVGMADSIGSLESVIANLNKQGAVMADKEIETVAADPAPDMTAALEQARTEAATAERERIRAVLDQVVPGCEALVNELAFDGKTSGPEAAMAVLAHLKKQGADALASIQQEAPEAVGIDTTTADDEADEKAEEEALIKAMAAGAK